MGRSKAQRKSSARAAIGRKRGAGRNLFADAKPIKDASVLIGGLPDDRSAEEILADLRAARRRGAAAP